MKKNLKIAIASDHAGFQLKSNLIQYLKEQSILVEDFGTYNESSVDYPDFAHPLAISIENNEANFGIAICGSGNGINITVNKHQKIRAALCWNSQIAEFARLHNDANICSLPARYISVNDAFEIIDAFLNTEFEGGRHQLRINKISIG